MKKAKFPIKDILLVVCQCWEQLLKQKQVESKIFCRNLKSNKMTCKPSFVRPTKSINRNSISSITSTKSMRLQTNQEFWISSPPQKFAIATRTRTATTIQVLTWTRSFSALTTPTMEAQTWCIRLWTFRSTILWAETKSPLDAWTWWGAPMLPFTGSMWTPWTIKSEIPKPTFSAKEGKVKG